MNQAVNRTKLRVGMVGMGMIFDETYRPFLENAYQHGIYDSRIGVIDIESVSYTHLRAHETDS